MSNDILDEFIFDSREHLANAGTQLLALEKDPQSLESLNALMGTLHTIKGNSGFVNLKNLYNLLHASETLLQTVRETGCLCPPPIIEQLFQVLDTAEVIMDRLENGESDEVDWLSALNQALREAELSLEEGGEAAVADSPGLAADSPVVSSKDSSPRAEAGPTPEPTTISGPQNIPIGPLVTLANGQLAEWGQSFLTSCQEARDRGQRSLVVDLTQLSQFSSQEMRLLVALSQTYGPDLALVLDPTKQPDFYRVLEVLDPLGVFLLYPDSAAALAALGEAAP
ncbi:MAG: Hpt domain-containing protein [Deltaproteobacteria bacterium]|jgi:chemotaxis protein histidine kinase CheA|nr:Hpt domain-containing protein [Deltaproteobacteria bacterium]